MAFDWTDYLDLARELAAPDVGAMLEEARLRSAASRAYYAAFKRAFNYLCGADPAIKFQRERAHQYVYEKFRYHPNAGWQEIGTRLERLRQLRNRADYDDQIADLPGDARKALQLAVNVIASLERLA